MTEKYLDFTSEEPKFIEAEPSLLHKTRRTQFIQVQCQNRNCNKWFSRGILNRVKRYCSSTCRARQNTHCSYLLKKDDEGYRKAKRDFFHIWYQKNKERQKINVMNDFRKNRIRWNHRHFLNRHKPKLKLFIENKCFKCGKENLNYFRIIDYGVRPHLLNSPHFQEKNLEMLEEYAKNIRAYCSKLCSIKHEELTR